MIRVPFDKLKNEFYRVLVDQGFDKDRADEISLVFASNSRDGVNSHGINRFPIFIDYVRSGLINKMSSPTPEHRYGAIERWNGNLGPGVLNAKFCMNRAIELARENGIGCVALKNTNHWMRGGTYGWQAADAGFIGICFTNTIANMPPWGGVDPRLGNNPLVIAVPKNEGHVVLDIAMSQYSYGKLSEYYDKEKKLPFAGGFDSNGSLTDDPGNILETRRTLPIGFWKGSGLSLMLDLLASALSEGDSTADISKTEKEVGISQVFMCISLESSQADPIIEQIISFTKSSAPAAENGEVLYPGENTLRTRVDSMENGVLVDLNAWNNLTSI